MSDRTEPDYEATDIERRLREQRPLPTGEQLDRVRRLSLSSAQRSLRPRLARMAMVSLLSGSLLVAGSSASLAVSGISGDGSAGTAQYRGPEGGGIAPSGDDGTTDPPDVLGGNTPGGTDPGPGETTPAADVAADPERQVASAGDDVLPFTGLAVVPLLMLGCALLVSGFVLRRRAHQPA